MSANQHAIHVSAIRARSVAVGCTLVPVISAGVETRP
jgi:hypothetical protein